MLGVNELAKWCHWSPNLETQAKANIFVFMIDCSGQWNMLIKMNDAADTTRHECVALSLCFSLAIFCFLDAHVICDELNWQIRLIEIDWNHVVLPRCRLSDFSVWLTEFAECAKTSANWAEVTRQDLYLSLEKYDSICNWFARWAAPVEQFKCIKVFKFNWIPELIHLHTSPLAKLCHNLVANCNQSGFHSCGQLSRPINLVRTMCECEMTSFAWTNKCRLIELITFENDMNRLTEMNEWTNVFKCSRRITRNYRLRLNSFHERRMTRFALEYSVFVCFGSVGRLINIILFEMCHSRHCHASCHTMSGMHAFALSQTRYTFSTFRI